MDPNFRKFVEAVADAYDSIEYGVGSDFRCVLTPYPAELVREINSYTPAELADNWRPEMSITKIESREWARRVLWRAFSAYELTRMRE